MKNLKFYLTVFAALLMLNLNLQSQTKDCNNLSTPYTMGFEDDETDFDNWTAIDGNNDNNSWYVHGKPRTGLNACRLSKYNNDWLYTPCFILNAVDTIKISFWYKVETSGGAIQNLKLSVRTTAPSKDSTVNILLLDIKNITNQKYLKADYYFKPGSSGTYYFGWFAHGNPYASLICYLDDIEISKFNCSGITTNLGADRTICKGDTITLDAGESLTDINWSSDLNNHTRYFKIWDAETIILNAKQAHCNVIDTITIYKFTYPEVLNIIAGGDTVICDKDSVMLNTDLSQDDIDNSTIKWYEEDTYSSVGTGATYKAKTPEYYYYKIEHNSLGCKATSNSKTVEVRYPYEGQELCKVVVENDINKLYWKNPFADDIAYYKIYKEGSIDGQYDSIGVVIQSTDTVNFFNDTLSMPGQKADRYKISVVDNCNNESSLSSYHKTMHLTINTGNNEVKNLSWDKYEGVYYPTIAILRDTSISLGTLELIAEISSSLYSFTDLHPNLLFKNYYVVGIPEIDCAGNKSFNGYEIISNIASDDKVEINELGMEVADLKISPNPASERLNVEFLMLNEGKVDIRLLDITGREVAVVLNEERAIGKNNVAFNIGNIDKGIYFVKAAIGENLMIKKIIKN